MIARTTHRERLGLDTALDLLADSYRRRLLVGLLTHNPRDETDPLYHAELPRTRREQARLQAVHTHLPKLEAADVIVWDRDTNQVSTGPRFDDLRPLLALLSDNADALPWRWP